MHKLLVLLFLPLIFSFSFTPMTHSLDISSEGTKTQFQILNNSNKPIPVVIKLKERVQLIDGNEKLPSTSDFQVIPPQLIIPAKDKRTIRLDYKGEKKIKQEQAYRVIAEQVPLNINKKDKKSGIEMLLKYQAALYVTNGEFKSDLKIEKFTNNKELKVILKNDGLAHQYLKNVKISFIKKDKKIEMNSKELKILEGQNVLAKSKREFSFNAIKGLDKTYKAVIKYD